MAAGTPGILQKATDACQMKQAESPYEEPTDREVDPSDNQASKQLPLISSLKASGTDGECAAFQEHQVECMPHARLSWNS